jgi:hypothetical protein
VAGAQLPGGARVPATGPGVATSPGTPPVAKPRQQDPAALKGSLDGFQAAFAKAAKESPEPARARPPAPARPGAPDGRRGGLTRRVPGTNMAPGLRKPVAGKLPARMASDWRPRDPNAERAQLDSLTAGLANAASAPAPQWPTEQVDTAKDKKGTNR